MDAALPQRIALPKPVGGNRAPPADRIRSERALADWLREAYPPGSAMASARSGARPKAQSCSRWRAAIGRARVGRLRVAGVYPPSCMRPSPCAPPSHLLGQQGLTYHCPTVRA